MSDLCPDSFETDGPLAEEVRERVTKGGEGCSNRALVIHLCQLNLPPNVSVLFPEDSSAINYFIVDIEVNFEHIAKGFLPILVTLLGIVT